MSFNSLCQKGIIDVTAVVVRTTKLSFFNFCHQFYVQSASPTKPRTLLRSLQFAFFLSLARINGLNRGANQRNMGHLIGYLWGINVQSIHVHRNQIVCMVQKKSCERWWLPQLRKSLQTIVCTAFGNASVQSFNHETPGHADRLASCWLSPCCLLHSVEQSDCVSLSVRLQINPL